MPALMRNSLTPSASWNTFCRLVQELFAEILTDIKSKFYYLRRLTYLLVLRVEVYQGELTASASAPLTRSTFITLAFIFGTRVGVLNSIAATGAAGETTHIIKFPRCDFSRALYLNTVNVQLKLVETGWHWLRLNKTKGFTSLLTLVYFAECVQFLVPQRAR